MPNPVVPDEVWQVFSGAHFAGFGDKESLARALQRYNELLLSEKALNAAVVAMLEDHGFPIEQQAIQTAIDTVMEEK